MDFSKIFKFGSTVWLENNGWRSERYKAYLQPVRYKNKVYLEGDFTEIGVNKNDVYIYLGPANHDLAQGNNGLEVVDVNYNRYIIDRSEKVTVDDKVCYIWAVLRQIRR